MTLSVFWPFELLMLRILCSVQYHILIGLISILMCSFLRPLYILEIRPASQSGTHITLQMNLLSTGAGRLYI